MNRGSAKRISIPDIWTCMQITAVIHDLGSMKHLLTPFQSIPVSASLRESRFRRLISSLRCSSFKKRDRYGSDGRNKKTQIANTKDGRPSIRNLRKIFNKTFTWRNATYSILHVEIEPLTCETPYLGLMRNLAEVVETDAHAIRPPNAP
jgi:hypothetical protein